MTLPSLFSLPVEDLQNIRKRAAKDLENLRNTHLFLTGCTSFFGKWLIEALLHADSGMGLGLRITALSRSPARFMATMPHLAEHKALRMVQGDMLDFDFMSVPAFTHVIHAANLPNDGSADWPKRHMEAALTGTGRLMEAAAAHGCGSILVTSSGSAYRAEPVPSAAAPSTAFIEKQQGPDDFLNEPAVYGLTKRFTETYATALGSVNAIRTVIARCFAFAGPHMPLAGPQALGNFILDSLDGKDIVIKGDGTALRSYMYGADLAVWLLALLVRGRHGVPYNVGSDEVVSIKEAANAVAGTSEGDIGVKVLGRPAPGNAPSVYVPDISRCREELCLNCEYSLKTILSKTIPWFRSRATVQSPPKQQ